MVEQLIGGFEQSGTTVMNISTNDKLSPPMPLLS